MLSPLAQSLSGEVGALFSKLSDPLREKLVGLAQSGAMSAEDVAAGLSGFAKVAKSAAVTGPSVANGVIEAQEALAVRQLANVGKSLSLASKPTQSGSDQQADALAEEGEALRRESAALRTKLKEDMRHRSKDIIASGIRIGEGIAMARLREMGVGDEIAKAAAE